MRKYHVLCSYNRTESSLDKLVNERYWVVAMVDKLDGPMDRLITSAAVSKLFRMAQNH